jgi:RNA polymerase sigma factor (sigma-70 family)
MVAEDHGADEARGAAAAFATTHWSVVLSAGDPRSPQSAQALETLCRAYWYPLYVFVRQRGYGPEDAQDLTQEFLARLLSTHALGAVHPAKGRFRSFLLASLKHFLANERDKARTLKRGGGRQMISWEQHTAEGRYAQEPTGQLSPEQIYEKHWATTLLERVLARLREESLQSQHGELFAQIMPHLWGEDEATPYAQLATRFNLSVSAIKVTVHRLRHRYREVLREEIAQTVADPNEINDEIQYLFRVTSA